MEGRAQRNCLAGNFSDEASLQEWHVTRRSIRAGSWYFSQKAVTVQGTPSPRLRCPKEGMARVFTVMVQYFDCVQWRAWPAVFVGRRSTSTTEGRSFSEGWCPGASFSRICHGAGFCKNHDEPINYTVRVMGQAFFICLVTRNLSRCRNYFQIFLVLLQKFY
jgi:hypothetical protein